MLDQVQNFRDLANEEFDTRTLSAECRRSGGGERKYEDFLIVDVDSHHYETEAFKEIAEYIDDPVLRHESKLPGHVARRHRVGERLLPGDRRPHHALSAAPEREGAGNAAPRHHADGALDGCAWASTSRSCSRRRCSTSSNCPRIEVEVALARAYNRWLCDKHPGAGAAHQVDALPAVPRSGGLLQDGRGVRRPQGRHRLHGHVDALQARTTTTPT